MDSRPKWARIYAVNWLRARRKTAWLLSHTATMIIHGAETKSCSPLPLQGKRWSMRARLVVVGAISDARRKGRFAKAENGKWRRFIGGIQLFCLQPSGDMDRCRFRKCRTHWLCASDVRVPLFLLLKTNMLSESCDCGALSNAIFYYSATHARTHAGTHTRTHNRCSFLCSC